MKENRNKILKRHSKYNIANQNTTRTRFAKEQKQELPTSTALHCA